MPKKGDRKWSNPEMAWLLERVPPKGRIPWVKITKEFNIWCKEQRIPGGEVNKGSLRGAWRRLIGDVTTDRPTDPNIYLEAMRSVDLAGDTMLEKLVHPKFPGLAVPEFDWEQWYEVAEKLATLTNDLDPTITSTEIDIETDKPIALMNVSDWHLGSRFVAYKTFRALLDLVMATERVYWGLYGDESDNFPMDWLPPAVQQVISPRSQRLLVKAIGEGLMERGKVLWAFWSNHYEFTTRKIGEDLMGSIWQGKVPYFQGKGVIKLNVGDEQYIIYASHEFKGSSMYNVNHPQMKALLWEVPQADFIIMGDKHKYGYSEVPHHDNAYYAGLHKSHIAHLLQIGTAKTGPDHYSIRGWSSGMLEWPIFILYPGEHKIKRAYEFADLEHFLDVKIDPILLKRLHEAAEEEGVKHAS